jgi:iron(III) transport system ATP-binding protein
MYLELDNLRKSFGPKDVIRDLSLGIAEHECVCLLGPSGCGKTTTLRIIGGFLTPDSGSVVLDGVDVTELDAARRDVATVFQNYALFGHMDVVSNVAYGLACRGVKKAERIAAAKEALARVHMDGYERARIRELSGGQQQRVALARGLVLKPKVLLLDEPLSNLDAGLRIEMRTQIKRLQTELGLTMVFVTHDQEEAMALGDRIAVMREGAIVQVAPPEELYRHPADRYVADFMGYMNALDTGGRTVRFRAEDATITPDGTYSGTIRYAAFLGPRTLYTLDVSGTEVRISQPGPRRYDAGDDISFNVVETPIGRD